MGGEAETRAFMEGGGTVIRSDNSHFYMDYPYGQIDVKHIWQAPRVPDYAKGLENRLLGVECPLWTERVTSLDRAAYLFFPRLTAVSCRFFEEERAWEAFRARVAALEKEREAATGLAGAPEREWDLPEEDAAAEREAEERKIRSGRAAYYVRRSEAVKRQDDEEREQGKSSPLIDRKAGQ